MENSSQIYHIESHSVPTTRRKWTRNTDRYLIQLPRRDDRKAEMTLALTEMIYLSADLHSSK